VVVDMLQGGFQQLQVNGVRAVPVSEPVARWSGYVGDSVEGSLRVRMRDRDSKLRDRGLKSGELKYELDVGFVCVVLVEDEEFDGPSVRRRRWRDIKDAAKEACQGCLAGAAGAGETDCQDGIYSMVSGHFPSLSVRKFLPA
jgi:hypothetical protein